MRRLKKLSAVDWKHVLSVASLTLGLVASFTLIWFTLLSSEQASGFGTEKYPVIDVLQQQMVEQNASVRAGGALLVLFFFSGLIALHLRQKKTEPRIRTGMITFAITAIAGTGIAYWIIQNTEVKLEMQIEKLDVYLMAPIFSAIRQGYVVGIFVTIFLSFLVASIVRYIRRFGIRSIVLTDKTIEEKLKAAFEPRRDSNEDPPFFSHNIYLGFMEGVLAFVAFSIPAYELIAGWLAFKLTSKWQTSSTIIKYPEQIEGVDPFEALRARNLEGANTLQRWLIGTLGNVLAGMIGAFITKEICKL